MKLGKRIILVGRAAAGKDHFKSFLVAQGYEPSISHTTRPPREGEINGKDYIFTCDTKFMQMVHDDEFHEWKNFNNWAYGTSREMFDNRDVFIFTPSGIEDLEIEEIKDSVIVFFDIDYATRFNRMLKRSDADSTQRRMNADALDFMDFNEYDIRVQNPEYDPVKLLETIINYLEV